METGTPATVTLDEEQRRSLESRLRSGAYGSASDVIGAALRALDREERLLDEIFCQKVEEALADPRPDIAAQEVFARLRARHAAQVKAAGHGA